MVLLGPGCKLSRHDPVKARVGLLGVVVDPPVFDNLPGMSIVGEQVLIQAFIPQPAVEAFHEDVLHWLARCDVVPFDPDVLLPSEYVVGGQLSAVIGDHHARICPEAEAL